MSPKDLPPLLGFQEKKTRLESPENNPKTTKFIRIRRNTVLQQIFLVIGMSAGALGISGCKTTETTPVVRKPEASATTTLPPETVSEGKPVRSSSYAVTERMKDEGSDLDWLHTPIDLSFRSNMFINYREESLKQLTFNVEDHSARRFAFLTREIDTAGDRIELSYYYKRAEEEWPPPHEGPPDNSPIQNGRLELGNWLWDNTSEQIARAALSPEFEAIRPKFLWNEALDIESPINLHMSFDLTRKPHKHPVALARMSDNVAQLLAFAAEKATPENPHLRALLRPLWLFLYHILGRMNAHIAHETAHSFHENIDMILRGSRTVSGIPGPPVFPRIQFLDREGYFVDHDEHILNERIESVAAGPNQHTILSRLMYLRNLQSPHPMSIFDAWTYLIQNNLMPGSAPLGYMISDKIREGKQGDHLGDINHYLHLLQEKDLDLNINTITRNKIATLLGTAETYRAVISVLNEIIGLINDISGLQIGKIPEFPRGVRVLGADVYWPLVEHYLVKEGEIINVILPVNPNGRFPVTLEFSTDLDNTQPKANVNTLRGGATVGYRNEWFTIEGGGVLATHRDELSEFRALSAIGRLTVPVPKSGLSFTVEVVHQNSMGGDDPIHRVMGIEDGLTATFILHLDW